MTARLVEVAQFAHQVTGVTVTSDGRIFVNFPRWTEDTAVSVAELLPDGGLRPYPDDRWNAWRNARKDELSPVDHWVCVQSVVADHDGKLWVLDPAAPAQDRLVPGGAKLVKIDPEGDRVLQSIAFDESSAPQGSYLNDVRFGLDGRHAFITDSGARGAIVVVALASGQARRVLDGHPSTQPEKEVQVQVDGQVLRRTDGRGVEFSADGIGMSPDGTWLYWQAIKGRTLYRAPTAALTDESLSADALARQVEPVGENGPADGLLIDPQGRMYITGVQEKAIKLREGGEVRVLLQDDRLRWPDTFAQGPGGDIYVTTSNIPDMQWFKPGNPLAHDALQAGNLTRRLRLKTCTGQERAPGRRHGRPFLPGSAHGYDQWMESVDASKFDEAYYARYYYDKKTKVADPRHVERLGAFVSSYLKYLRVPVRRVLDVGCGVGLWRDIMARHFPQARYHGVEISEYLCGRYGWERGSVVDYQAGDAFDFVICQGVLAYLSPVDLKRALRNLGTLSHGALYVEAVTLEDYEHDIVDEALTDPLLFRHRADVYRQGLSRKFKALGGGLWLSRQADVPLFALECPAA